MDLTPILIVLGIAVVIAIAIFSHLAAKKRREAMAAWAAANGLTFSRAKDYSFDNRFDEFDCLKQGSRRYAFNIMEGDYHDRPLLAFDYHYETYSTDSKGRRRTNHHYFSAVVVRYELPLKPLTMRKEGFFDKVSGLFGFDDIDFESAEFSKEFHVKAPDRKWAYDVLHTRAIEFMLAQPRFSMEMYGKDVIAWRGGRFDPEEFEQAAAVVEGLLDQLPEYVKRELENSGV